MCILVYSHNNRLYNNYTQQHGLILQPEFSVKKGKIPSEQRMLLQESIYIKHEQTKLCMLVDVIKVFALGGGWLVTGRENRASSRGPGMFSFLTW